MHTHRAESKKQSKRRGSLFFSFGTCRVSLWIYQFHPALNSHPFLDSQEVKKESNKGPVDTFTPLKTNSNKKTKKSLFICSEIVAQPPVPRIIPPLLPSSPPGNWTWWGNTCKPRRWLGRPRTLRGRIGVHLTTDNTRQHVFFFPNSITPSFRVSPKYAPPKKDFCGGIIFLLPPPLPSSLDPT